MMKPVFLSSLLLTLQLFGCQSISESPTALTDLEILAPTPPMGWNSYDCYDWRINEAEFKANVDFMADHLLEYGYEYAVVDFLWYFIDSSGQLPIQDRQKRARKLRYNSDGNLIDPIAIDSFGRVLPDPIRFPSAAKGNGFKELAGYVHGKGLKFGIHIMRGIPRIAAHHHLPIKGTNFTADQIAEPADTNIWENSMYGVDYETAGAQEYYNSLIELYASWGVDFIKADDIMYPEFHKEEIRMIREAIVQTGHPIVLSLSLGEPRFYEAEFLQEHANMWRISGDFWDNWDQVVRQFDLCNFWANYTRPGSFPDADMLPVGHISLAGHKGPDRMSRLTWPEQGTMITLWSIARSPLMIGADLPTSPDSTLYYLTNSEVLYVNQHSIHGHRVYQGWADNTIVWYAEDTKSDDIFLALFNTADQRQQIRFNLELVHMRSQYALRDLWEHQDLGIQTKFVAKELPGHGAALFRLTPIN